MSGTVDFLDWLLQLNFVLLGYREYDLLDLPEGRAIKATEGSGLGILSDVSRSTFADVTALDSLPSYIRQRIEDGDLLVISKTKAYSTVHRRARMDYVGVRKVSPDGRITGEARLIGLFTSKAYMEPATKTPLLHHKLEQILAAEDLIPGSHDYKTVVELFGTFPKDELFQGSAEELRTLVIGLLQFEEQAGIRVLIRKDLFGRQVSIVVALPRERFTARLRKRLQDMFMERFHGVTVDYHLSLGETESAKIFFTVHVEPGVQVPEIPHEELEADVERLARTWDDDLADALAARLGEQRGRALAATYAPRFPDYYKTSDTDWALAVDDVLNLEELASWSGSATSRQASGSRGYVSTRPEARSTFRPSCRCSSRSASASSRRSPSTWRAKDGSSSTTSASWTLAVRCSTSRARPRRSATRSARCGAARRRWIPSTAW